MWGYLALGPGLPLPEGVEVKPGGMVLAAGARPLVLRTFLPDAGARAIAVGYPGGVSLAFDAQRARLAYAWSGAFLDAAPVWGGRGGNPARVLGVRFWNAPPGCPLEVSAAAGVPDFKGRAKDPAYGAPPPGGKVFAGVARLRFKGYALDKGRAPTFRYELTTGKGAKVAISERPEALRKAVAVGLARHFKLAVPAGHTTWLFAGETGGEPRLLGARGGALALDLKPGKAQVPAADRYLVLPQGGERAVVLRATGIPAGSRWRLRKVSGTWQALLEVLPRKEAWTLAFDLRVWAPYRDEPALLKELLAR
jgi:hypothetical protein